MHYIDITLSQVLSRWEGLRALKIITAETLASNWFNHAGQVPGEGPDEYLALQVGG